MVKTVWHSNKCPNPKSKLTAWYIFAAIAPLAVVNLILWGCSPSPERLPAYQYDTPLLWRQITGDTRSFAAYIQGSQDLIRKARFDLDSIQKEKIIHVNTPFEYRPDPEICTKQTGTTTFENGVLLIHGLTASPYIMRDLGEFFRSRCFLVRAVLLPGHGTRPGDLLNIRYQHWVKAVSFAAQSFQGEVKNLYLSGYSIGGTLAVHYALGQHASATDLNPGLKQAQTSLPTLKGLFLFSPALRLKTCWGFLAGIAALFSDWMSRTSDGDYAAYESLPYNAAAQSYQLIQETKNRLVKQENLPVPVFVALSEDDETVDAMYTIDIFRHYLNQDPNRLQLYTTQPQSYVLDARIEALQSRIDTENILSFSHTSITIPKKHSHYGANGNYRRCLHYTEQSTQWQACKTDPGIMQAEVSESILKEHTIRQLTYNAYFSKMLIAMANFLDQLRIPVKPLTRPQ